MPMPTPMSMSRIARACRTSTRPAPRRLALADRCPLFSSSSSPSSSSAAAPSSGNLLRPHSPPLHLLPIASLVSCRSPLLIGDRCLHFPSATSSPSPALAAWGPACAAPVSAAAAAAAAGVALKCGRLRAAGAAVATLPPAAAFPLQPWAAAGAAEASAAAPARRSMATSAAGAGDASVKAAAAVAEVQGRTTGNGFGVITLDRPKALNAMNIDMDVAYKTLLDEWAKDDSIKAVLVEGSTPRAFSAGMDIKGAAAIIKADPTTPFTAKVFTAEYSLICAIARFPKPYIALMDGVTMGFGLGLSGHGSHRIVTEKTLLAMPENAIGLFPDVGFAHIAARSPGGGAVGMYMALSGARVATPADALLAGIGTHFVPCADLPALREALLTQTTFDAAESATDTVNKVIARFAKPVEDAAAGKLASLLPAIQRCFPAADAPAGASPSEAIAASLLALDKEAESADAAVAAWAKETKQAIGTGAPFSLAVTQQHFSSVAQATAASATGGLAEIEEVMRSEFRIALRTATRGDFIEGVRAVLIDKDKNPRWSPASLADLDDKEISAVFEPLGAAGELQL